MSQLKVKITFHGGTGLVTGSNFLVESLAGDGTKILIDCGLIQGTKKEEELNWAPFPYYPEEITALIVTHAHLDHIGRVPKLVKDGFKGVIYSTPATKEISDLSLADSVNLLTRQADRTGEDKLYEEADVHAALSLWQTHDYHQPFTIGPFSIVFRNSGHILGSAMVELTIDSKKIIFTGDLGNSPSPILPDCEEITDADYLIMESVYGDRNHEGREDRRARLEDVIEETMKRGGTLVIPAFSIERTQEILFEIEQMIEHSRVPLVPVFLDSPLGIKVMAVYKKYLASLNQAARAEEKHDGLFRFPNLHFTLSTEESKAIIKANARKIIMAGSGMSTGGRILHHEKAYLTDPKSTLLLVGYQTVGTLGRRLQDGVKKVRILGEEINIKAAVENISGYSGHKDSDHLLDFVHHTADMVKKVFVVMGEPKSSLFLVQRLRDYLGLTASAPVSGESVELSW
ncbi:MAG: MBL fold metallo-hydrolase [bacterium]|nr:MBL fold metallo-hydrolase [bacterium]